MAKSSESGPKPRNDAYTGLLAISFLALVGATVLMAMDASDLGTPPAAFEVKAPGIKTGTPGEGLKRTDTTKIDTSPNPEPKAPEPKAPEPKGEEPKAPEPKAPEPKAPPGNGPGAPPKGNSAELLSNTPVLEDVPGIVVPAPIIRVGATEPAVIAEPKQLPKLAADPLDPPLNIKPFIPPMQ